MRPGPKSQLVSVAFLLTVVSNFTEIGQALVLSVSSPTCLSGLSPDTDSRNALQAKQGTAFLTSKSGDQNKSLSSKVQTQVSIL
jgi:hypothetical protein